MNPLTGTGCTSVQGVPKKTDPLVYFDDNFGIYRPISIIFSLLQQEIYDAQKLSYFSHLTFIMLPLCWYQCEFFWIMQQNKFVCIPTAEIFIYLFTAMLRDINCQNGRVYGCKTGHKTDVPAVQLNREQQHFCQNMVSVRVSLVGKTNMIFVDPSAKVNNSYYCQFIMGKGLLPDIQARCHQHKWTFQQDGAPAHTARNTTDYLMKANMDFIEPDMWTPNSPTVNPVDYAVWGPFSKESTTDTVEELKRVITTEWKKTVATFY